MAEVPAVRTLQSIENKRFRGATTESLYEKIAEAINFILKNVALDGIGSYAKSNQSEAAFQVDRGAGWILADGRSVVGSAYESLTGNSTIPDVRGRFFRGKNNGRSDGNENPSGELALGTFQADALKDHTHDITRVTSSEDIFSSKDRTGPPVHYSGSNEFASISNFNQLPDPTGQGPRTIGPETAPRHTVWNVFIRIN